MFGCAKCAAVCRTGGEEEVKRVEKLLANDGITVTGMSILDPACNLPEARRLYRKKDKEINAADVILSYACGGGTQTLSEVIKGKEFVSGNDTLFQGEIAEWNLKKAEFNQKCSLCGECMLNMTGGICPITRCSKSLVNGPCGGVKEGMCETDKSRDCAWILIYKRLKESGRVSCMREICKPKNYEKNKNPQNLIVQ